MYLLTDFNQKVKSYSRLSKGKLIQVNQYSRKGDNLTTEEDDNLRKKVQVGAIVVGTAAIAGLSLVGLSVATKNIVKNKYAENLDKAVVSIKNAKPIDDFKKYSRFNPSTLDNIDKYDNIVITTGGFSGNNGHTANNLRASLARKYRKSLVLAVENKDFDTAIPDVSKRILATPELLFNTAMKGNKSATDLAEVVYNIRAKTDKPITLIGTSAGGMTIKNAQEITDRLGVKNIQGIGLGSPTFGISQPKSPYNSVISGNDPFKYLPGLYKPDIIQVQKTFDTSKVFGLTLTERLRMRVSEHMHNAYLANPEVNKILERTINRK